MDPAARPGVDQHLGFHGHPADHCVFCSEADQPPAMLVGDEVRVVPDKYPLTPGHVLLISRDHLRCYGDAPAAVCAELDRLTERVCDFTSSAYGPALVWENGIAGQSVFHAHLHVIPLQVGTFADLTGQEGAHRVSGWADVSEFFHHRGHYHYAEWHGLRWVLEPDSPALWVMRANIAHSSGLRFVDGEWRRPTSPADVDELSRRWKAWEVSAGG